MSRKFKTVDYEKTLELKISLGEALLPNHLARFVVDIVGQLDLSSIYKHFAPRGGVAYAPEILLGLLFYGYATEVFSSRKSSGAPMRVSHFGTSRAICIRTMTRLPTFARRF